MGKILVILGVLFVFAVIWSLPLYLCLNFVFWVFHIPFHITLLQAFAVGLLATVIHSLLFKNKEG